MLVLATSGPSNQDPVPGSAHRGPSSHRSTGARHTLRWHPGMAPHRPPRELAVGDELPMVTWRIDRILMGASRPRHRGVAQPERRVGG